MQGEEPAFPLAPWERGTVSWQLDLSDQDLVLPAPKHPGLGFCQVTDVIPQKGMGGSLPTRCPDTPGPA